MLHGTTENVQVWPFMAPTKKRSPSCAVFISVSHRTDLCGVLHRSVLCRLEVESGLWFAQKSAARAALFYR